MPEKIAGLIATGFALPTDLSSRLDAPEGAAAFETGSGGMAFHRLPFGGAAGVAHAQRLLEAMRRAATASDTAAGFEFEDDLRFARAARQGAGGTQAGAQAVIAACRRDRDDGQRARRQATTMRAGQRAERRQQAFVCGQRAGGAAQRGTRAGRRFDGPFAAGDLAAEPAEEGAPSHGDLAGGRGNFPRYVRRRQWSRRHVGLLSVRNAAGGEPDARGLQQASGRKVVSSGPTVLAPTVIDENETARRDRKLPFQQYMNRYSAQTRNPDGSRFGLFRRHHPTFDGDR